MCYAHPSYVMAILENELMTIPPIWIYNHPLTVAHVQKYGEVA